MQKEENKSMREIKNGFWMIEYTSPKDALLQVFSFLLSEGKSKNYGVYYIWKKNDKYYSEISGAYHSASLWRDLGYRAYDIIEIKNYKRTYFHDTKEDILTGFMFHGDKFFDKNIKYLDQ